MKILLLGNTGQLGYELERSLACLGPVQGLDYPQLDLTRPDEVRQLIRAARPQVILNATAYTAVDRAEQEEALAMAVNALAPGVLAQEAQQAGAALIHYSTDYVFDGLKGSPYHETDPTNPVGVYAVSKLAGERAVAQNTDVYWTFRTAWVYSTRRECFATKVLQWARQQTRMRLVTDQISNPTWCRMLAEMTANLLAQARGDVYAFVRQSHGLYHLAGGGYASRLEWAQEILALDPNKSEQIVQEVLPAKVADFPTSAPRPLFTALDCSHFEQTFGLALPFWKDALRLALQPR